MWRTMMMLASIGGMVGCTGDGPEPVLATGVSVQKYVGRTLAVFQAKLNKSLTPALAEKRFGKPDSIVGSGLLIYVYKLDDGCELMLGFSGFQPLLYAKVKSADGSVTDLPLK